MNPNFSPFPSDPRKTPRTLILGLDGADWVLVNRLVRKGRLPHFEKVFREGAVGPLKTYIPTLSPLIWTTLVTGHTPSTHGIENFLIENNRGVIGSVSSRQRKVPALWNVLSAYGVPVGVNNWWATWPAEPVNGYVVSDYGIRSTKNRPAFPDGLASELQPEMEILGNTTVARLKDFVGIPDYLENSLEVPKEFLPENPISRLDFCLMIDETVKNFRRYMTSHIPVDVEFVYFTGLDAVQHWFWEYMEPGKVKKIREANGLDFSRTVENYYVYMDSILGDLMREIGPEGTLFFMSDHGFEANPAYVPEPGKVSGFHECAPDGIFGAIGKGILPGNPVSLSVYDVMPTLLAHFGYPVGQDMPGACRTDVFDSPKTVSFIPTYTVPPYFNPAGPDSELEKADQLILSRLEALGYID